MSSVTGLSFRFATPRDYEGIHSIDPNIYGGFDYLPSQYLRNIKDPNYVGMVCLKNGKIIGYWSARVVDRGTTVIGPAPRVHPEFRSAGIWQDFRQQYGMVRDRFPALRRTAFTAGDRDLHLDRIQEGKSNHRYVLERPILVFHITPDQVADMQNVSIRAPRPDHLLRSLSGTQALQLMNDLQVQWKLFTFRRLIMAWDPYRLYEDNFKEIVSRWREIAGTFDEAGQCQALSFSQPVDAKKGTRLNIEYYGLDTDDAIAHARHHVISLSKQNHNSTKAVFPWVSFPVTLDRARISRALGRDYEEVNFSVKGAFGAHLFEYDWIPGNPKL